MSLLKDAGTPVDHLLHDDISNIELRSDGANKASELRQRDSTHRQGGVGWASNLGRIEEDVESAGTVRLPTVI
jgi:hypothetical protein